jgi:hypothetical protein
VPKGFPPKDAPTRRLSTAGRGRRAVCGPEADSLIRDYVGIPSIL